MSYLQLAIVIAVFSIVISSSKAQEAQQYNVVGTKLQPCSMEPLTGWFRDGYCTYDKYDVGVHVVCGTMTKEVRKNIVKNSSFSNPMFFFSFWHTLKLKAMICPLHEVVSLV